MLLTNTIPIYGTVALKYGIATLKYNIVFDL